MVFRRVNLISRKGNAPESILSVCLFVCVGVLLLGRNLFPSPSRRVKPLPHTLPASVAARRRSDDVENLMDRLHPRSHKFPFLPVNHALHI